MDQQEQKVEHEQTDDQLLKEILQKEALIKKLATEKAEDQKQINHIKRSKTWKMTKPFHKLRRFFTRILGLEKRKEQVEYIHHLEDEIKALEETVFEMKSHLQASLLDDRTLNSQQLVDLLREKKEDGSIINYIDDAIDQKEKHLNNYNEALIYAARLFMNERTDKKNLVYKKVLQALKTEEIPEFMMRAGLTEEQPLTLTQVASFRGSLSKRLREKQQLGILPEYTLEDKQAAYEFVDQLDVRRPKLTEGTFSFQNLPKQAGTVIKPVDGAGSRGVYLIYALDDIIDMKRSENITNLLELEERMQQDLTLGWVSEDKWMAEELILENREEKRPASDLKFYCFYGKVGLILEISRYPERKHCWWTDTGERIRTGKYEEELFKGNGVTKEEIELAKQISENIPAPFIRIDFLRSEQGLVFGEFTAKPGNYDEFDRLTDEWLGDYFIEAEGKLFQDLFANKNFSEYKSFIEKQGYNISREHQLEPTN